MNGTKLGDYEIVRLIGRGGMGAVYEAMNAVINRRAAIKLLLPEYAEREDVVRRFFNEARAVNAINHPGVVQVSEVGTAPDGSLFLVMEFLEGETLAERLAKCQGRLGEEESIIIGWQLSGVLAAAHSKSIIHRDIKPGNVMMVPDMAGPGGERVKLLDFGIAKLGAEHFQGEEVHTRTGQVMGTASYMSPEQFQGEKPVDAQSDVYSLGVVMYRLLAGRLPFVSQSGEMAIAAMHMFKPPQPLKTLAPHVSPWLHELVDSMLRKDAAERPTMQDVMTRLQDYVPFRSTSRTNIKPLIGVERSGLLRLNSIDPTISADDPQPAAVQSADTAVLSATRLDGAAAASQPGTITRATGQLSVSTFRGVKVRRRTLLVIAGASLLTATLSGVLMLRSFIKPPATATVPPSAAPPAVPPRPSPAPPTSPPPASPSRAVEKGTAPAPPAAPAPKDATTPPKEKAAATAPPAKPASAPHNDKSGRRGHKTDSRKDGKSRSTRKPQSTHIIN